MIPKIIHYCWLSDDPIPVDLNKYMKTWKKYLPEYEYMLWNKDRFDINSSIWVKQAYENKKYAFAADYIRIFALHNFGGIYMDMDVEVLKSFNPLLDLNMFVGYDHHSSHMEMATWGIKKGSEITKVLLEYYDNKEFVLSDNSFDTETIPQKVTRILCENGYNFRAINSIEEAYKNKDKKTITILPRTFFCPLDWYTFKLYKTDETFSIHHYKGSWLPKNIRRERFILRRLGNYLPSIWRKIQRCYLNK